MRNNNCGTASQLGTSTQLINNRQPLPTALLQDAGDDGVVMAKFDATANDSPEDPKLYVRGYPTLYFVTAQGNGQFFLLGFGCMGSAHFCGACHACCRAAFWLPPFQTLF